MLIKLLQGTETSGLLQDAGFYFKRFSENKWESKEKECHIAVTYAVVLELCSASESSGVLTESTVGWAPSHIGFSKSTWSLRIYTSNQSQMILMLLDSICIWRTLPFWYKSHYADLRQSRATDLVPSTLPPLSCLIYTDMSSHVCLKFSAYSENLVAHDFCFFSLWHSTFVPANCVYVAHSKSLGSLLVLIGYFSHSPVVFSLVGHCPHNIYLALPFAHAKILD